MEPCKRCNGTGTEETASGGFQCKVCKGTGKRPVQVKIDCDSGDGYYAKLKLTKSEYDLIENIEIEVFRPRNGEQEHRISHIALNLQVLELTLDYLKRGGK
ncbi:DnaJ-like protein [Bacillus phage BC01]|nr:hypothetical protein PBC6_071 [Bacillus phage PBC6]AXU41177.1 DnaJ-like protein [Bacillus phage BC01]